MSSRGFLAEGAASAKALRQRLEQSGRGSGSGRARGRRSLKISWHLVQPRLFSEMGPYCRAC